MSVFSQALTQVKRNVNRLIAPAPTTESSSYAPPEVKAIPSTKARAGRGYSTRRPLLLVLQLAKDACVRRLHPSI